MKAVYDTSSSCLFIAGSYSSKRLAPYEINGINLAATQEDIHPAGIPYFTTLHLAADVTPVKVIVDKENIRAKGGADDPAGKSLIALIDEEYLAAERKVVVQGPADISPVRDRKGFIGRGVCGHDAICASDHVLEPVDITERGHIVGKAKRLDCKFHLQEQGDNDTEPQRKEEDAAFYVHGTYVHHDNAEGNKDRVKNRRPVWQREFEQGRIEEEDQYRAPD